MTDIKLISLDVDGTLLTSTGELLDQNKSAIQEAIRNDIHVVLNSGKPPCALEGLIPELGLKDPISTMGGALILDITDPEDWNVIHLENLPDDILFKLAPLVEGLPLTIQIHTEQETYFYHEKDDEEYRAYFKGFLNKNAFRGGVFLDRSPLLEFDQDPSPIIKIVFHSDEDEPVDEAFQRIKGIENEIIMIGYSSPRTIDLSPRASGKKEAIEYLCGLYDIKPEQVLALGDYETDLDLINWAGVGAVMANAPEFVLAKAPRLAPENDQAGVAQMIEEFVLKGTQEP